MDVDKISSDLFAKFVAFGSICRGFLIVDGFASFLGYNLLGGSGGIMDAGLLLVTYVYQVAFPGGSGQFNFPGAAAMSLLVVPATALFLFILLQNRQRLWVR